MNIEFLDNTSGLEIISIEKESAIQVLLDRERERTNKI